MLDHRHVRSGLVLLALAATAAGCDYATETPLEPELGIVGSHHRGQRAFDVYTQNVFVGGDTGPILTIDFSNIPALVDATDTFWQDVLASDGPGRAKEIVDQIANSGAEVVALQEVFRFIVLDATMTTPLGGLDYLAEIENEIVARALPYETAVVHDATSSALPLALGATGVTQWLAFTDRIATLRRTDTELVSTDEGRYDTELDLGPVQIRRGWARTTLSHRGENYHFVNTHLEIQQLAPVQAGQAFELINDVLDGLDGVTVLAGDFNSDAAGEPGEPAWTPTYGDLVDAGFTDVWAASPPRHRGEGLTCCQDQSLTAPFDLQTRVDLVMVRRADGSGPPGHRRGLRRGLFRADLVGEEEADRTPSGRWPSDHAGIVANIRLPRTHVVDWND